MKTPVNCCLLSLILVLGLSSSAQAFTRATFFGLHGMIQILPTDSSGGTDPDAHLLFEAMNVPTQGSVMGPGKAIVSSKRIFNLSCGRSQKGDQCSLLLQNSPEVSMNPLKKTMSYVATASDAEAIRGQFFLDENQEFHLLSTDGTFRLDVDGQTVSIKYSENGL